MKKSNGLTVAIKRMCLESSSEGFPITSLKEITLLKFLKHPNIIRLFEVACAKYAPPEHLLNLYSRQCIVPFNYPWNFFMVCEYMDYSLKGLLAKGVEFTLPQIKNIIFQVLNGLAFLHFQKVMHRDIKCSNILMNKSGEIKLGDFGMSTRFVPDTLLNGAKTVVTLWYRAPELLLHANYSEAIDMWGIGCVLAELILGDALFKGNSEEEQLQAICSFIGVPNEKNWPGIKKLPNYEKMKEKLCPNTNSKKLRELLQQNSM